MTIAVLSWRSHLTLKNTLESYQKNGLDKLDDQKIIFFQEITDDDRAIAAYYGYEFMGSHSNVGIARAFQELVEASTGDLFLLLENDWELINPFPAPIIYQAADMLRNWIIDVARLRHRTQPGEPLWSRQFK